MASKRVAQPTRELWRVFGPASILAIIGFVVAYQFVDPAPPERIFMATGRPDGAYYRFALAYQRFLGESGIKLELRETAGSQDNIAQLQLADSTTDIAIVQGGTPAAAEGREVLSLGSVFFEPLWVFSRGSKQYTRVPELAGLHLAIGPAGSGTRAVMLQLLEDNGIADAVTLSALTGLEAAAALDAEQIDVLALVASPQSPAVRQMLLDPRFQLMHFARAAAYSRVHPFMSMVTLPEGVIDLRQNIPPRDTVLVACTAGFAVTPDFHPALSDLILQAAAEVHSSGGIFEDPEQFPSEHYVDFPLSKEAKRYYKYGPPLLQRYMPFWAATLVDRLKVMMLPLIALALPLFRLMPPIYRWSIRSRIYKWYREIDDLYDAGPGAPAGAPEDLQRLDAIENEVAQTSIPLSYHEELYNLHLHIDYVRKHLSSPAADSADSRKPST